MAFGHGKDSALYVDDSGGTPTALTTYITDVDFPETVDVAETTTMGDSAKEYIVGLKDATVSVTGIWEPTCDSLLNGILGLAGGGTIKYSPQGTASGKIYYSAEALLTSYQITGGVGDKVGFSAEFQITGAVSRGTH